MLRPGALRGRTYRPPGARLEEAAHRNGFGFDRDLDLGILEAPKVPSVLAARTTGTPWTEAKATPNLGVNTNTSGMVHKLLSNQRFFFVCRKKGKGKQLQKSCHSGNKTKPKRLEQYFLMKC